MNKLKYGPQWQNIQITPSDWLKILLFCLFTVGAFAFSQYLFGGGELKSIPDARDDDITTLMNQRAQLYFLSQLLFTKKFSFYPKIWDKWARDLLNLYKHCRAGVRANLLSICKAMKSCLPGRERRLKLLRARTQMDLWQLIRFLSVELRLRSNTFRQIHFDHQNL